MTKKLQRQLVIWAAIFAATAGLLVVAAVDRGGAETDAERHQRLSQAYACPVCAGQSVAESNAEVAGTIRQQIRTEMQAGSSDQDIRDVLVGQYGGEVLLNPPAEGFASLVWVLPVVVGVGGAAGVAAAVSGRRLPTSEATEEDKRLVSSVRGKAEPSLESEAREASSSELGDDRPSQRGDDDSEPVDVDNEQEDDDGDDDGEEE